MRATTGCDNSLPAHDTRGSSDTIVQGADRLHGPSGLSKAPAAVQAAVIFALACISLLSSPGPALGQGWGSPPQKPVPTPNPTTRPSTDAPPATQPAATQPATSIPTAPATQPAPGASTTPVTRPPAAIPNAPGKQSQSFSKNLAGFLTIDLLLYIGIAMICMGGIIWVVQRTRNTLSAPKTKAQEPTTAGFSIEEIEKLKDQGLLSPAEYRRALSRAQTSSPTNDAPSPQQAKKSSRPDEPPPTAPGLFNPSPDPKSPPSGSSPDPRNGELW